jgi:hypothetical protein
VYFSQNQTRRGLGTAFSISTTRKSKISPPPPPSRPSPTRVKRKGAHENPPTLPGLPLKLTLGLPLPFSYNHLLFNPSVALLPFVGVARLPPPTASNSLTLSGEFRAEDDVYDNFRLSLPPPRGLPNGELPRRLESRPLPRPESGE